MDDLKLKDQTQESLLRESSGYPAIPREDVPRITDYSEATPSVAQPIEGQQTSLLAIPRLIVTALAFVCINGLYRLSGISKWELIGGGQFIIGFFLIAWGLMFLRFLDDEPGFIDSLAERLLQR